jgi:hypothetical protein
MLNFISRFNGVTPKRQLSHNANTMNSNSSANSSKCGTPDVLRKSTNEAAAEQFGQDAANKENECSGGNGNDDASSESSTPLIKRKCRIVPEQMPMQFLNSSNANNSNNNSPLLLTTNNLNASSSLGMMNSAYGASMAACGSTPPTMMNDR